MITYNISELNGGSSLNEAILYFLKSSGLEEAIKEIVKNAVNESSTQPEAAKANENSEYYTRSELCQLAHITETTLWRLEKAGIIRKIKLGRKNLYSRLDVDALLGSGGFHFLLKNQGKAGRVDKKRKEVRK